MKTCSEGGSVREYERGEVCFGGDAEINTRLGHGGTLSSRPAMKARQTEGRPVE